MAVLGARRAVLGLCLSSALLLSACHSTGTGFRSLQVNALTPGVTSFQDTVELLEADPVNRYYRTDGSFLAVWQHTNSVLPDGVYFNRELWAEFDASQRLLRVVKERNIHQAKEKAGPGTY